MVKYKFALCNLTLLPIAYPKTLQQMANLVEAQTQRQTGRSFGGQLQTAIESMNEMSCWCYFGDDHGRGRGPVMDEIDQICKTLADGYDCAMIDHEEELRRNSNDDCVPWDVDYRSAVGGTSEQLTEACNRLNRNKCAARACIVEGNFISSLTLHFISGGSVNMDYKHENGFDHVSQCVGKAGVPADEKRCCGKYPMRFPYKPMGGERDCCGIKTYNTFALECCDAGTGLVRASC